MPHAPLPVMTMDLARCIGFAGFNDVPTLPVDIPDGGFTISARTTEGRRITFFFGAHDYGGPARFVDVQYHDSRLGPPDPAGRRPAMFDAFAVSTDAPCAYDSRTQALHDKPTILVVLLSDPADHE